MKRTVSTSSGGLQYDLIRTTHNEARVLALPGGEVRLYAPAGLSLKDADALVRQNAQTLCARCAALDAPVTGVPGAAEQLMAAAQERIMQRLEYFHAHIGGQYTSVSASELGIKWGACSHAHELSFNWRLILAPEEALDYVVIHELCHLHEFSHSSRFWRMVQKHMPEYEAWKKWLSDHKQELLSV